MNVAVASFRDVSANFRRRQFSHDKSFCSESLANINLISRFGSSLFALVAQLSKERI